MISLAGRDILHSWGKFVFTGIGLGLLIGVTFTMAGVYRGMVDDGKVLLDNSGADMWVVQQNTLGPYAESSSAADGDKWRRVVASPKPVEIPDFRIIRLLLDHGVIVVCTGGGGIPVVRRDDGSLIGIEAVIDKDAASALLARQLGADALLLLTDVDAVYRGFGSVNAGPIVHMTPDEARAFGAPAGSMGPKIVAAGDFADTGGFTGIGRLEDAIAILDGHAGTRIDKNMGQADPSVWR